jgi:hypothetical protein
VHEKASPATLFVRALGPQQRGILDTSPVRKDPEQNFGCHNKFCPRHFLRVHDFQLVIRHTHPRTQSQIGRDRCLLEM